MAELHQILFNMHILYSLALAVWAVVAFTRNSSISGNFWGAIATYALLAAGTLLLGIALLLSGYEPRSGRVIVYVLYMIWLAIIMPGLFSLMNGRDDRQAALAFALLAVFNAGTSLSMIQRELVGPWISLSQG